ncbi:MAG: hypothetical protein EOO77_01495 [Oxalobacteraceae bacterium]|nr:MAG: hypothetical protein EOO77_01495 [Oxalobacteraceae bacterium]
MKRHQIATIAAVTVGCLGQIAAFAQHPGVTYKTHLTVVNPGKVGSPAEGEATFRVVGDKFKFTSEWRMYRPTLNTGNISMAFRMAGQLPALIPRRPETKTATST